LYYTGNPLSYVLALIAPLQDLQVKSSPPAQPTTLHNDPAIIQVNIHKMLGIFWKDAGSISFEEWFDILDDESLLTILCSHIILVLPLRAYRLLQAQQLILPHTMVSQEFRCLHHCPNVNLGPVYRHGTHHLCHHLQMVLALLCHQCTGQDFIHHQVGFLICNNRPFFVHHMA
jgi:hypothetical protein